MRRTVVASLSLTLSMLVAFGAFTSFGACKSEKKPAGGGSAASGASADDPWGGSDTPKAPAEVIAKPLLWKLEKDGTTSWLFGTIHLGVNADKQLPPIVFQRLEESKVFAMEANTNDPGLATAMRRSDGGSLRADLGPEYWKKLEDAIGARVAEQLEGMKPFAAMTVLIARDLPMTLPMDRVLSERAQGAGKPIHYFEQAIDQIAMIEPWMSPDDVKALLDNRDVAKNLAGQMLEAYKRGDGDALGAMFDDKTLWLAAKRKPETFPAYLDAILGKRNRAWIPQIEKLHADGGAFIAVGAGHLVGPSNVLGLLGERGYTVTRVTP
ncbi:MAG TPA: TraB/GumN family protein [Kofleriaceae bacterium]|nr:TraB/GumN family protein [Kofleriaceae bacterium]